jgi:SAM-dependent methyltransferase
MSFPLLTAFATFGVSWGGVLVATPVGARSRLALTPRIPSRTAAGSCSRNPATTRSPRTIVTRTVGAMDPLANSPWSSPETVAGFTRSGPNQDLLRFAQDERQRSASRCLDIGCGAGRNAVALARQGWRVVGVDLSEAMLRAAVERQRDALHPRVHVALAPMDSLPVVSRSFDLVIAHGIWNLACSDAELRRGIAEAARVAAAGAGLFVFTFSRNTLASEATPLPGEKFIFTEFSGQPQCFLTADQLLAELHAVGFAPDPGFPLRELNLPRPGTVVRGGPPIIYQGAFRLAR